MCFGRKIRKRVLALELLPFWKEFVLLSACASWAVRASVCFGSACLLNCCVFCNGCTTKKPATDSELLVGRDSVSVLRAVIIVLSKCSVSLQNNSLPRIPRAVVSLIQSRIPCQKIRYESPFRFSTGRTVRTFDELRTIRFTRNCT